MNKIIRENWFKIILTLGVVAVLIFFIYFFILQEREKSIEREKQRLIIEQHDRWVAEQEAEKARAEKARIEEEARVQAEQEKARAEWLEIERLKRLEREEHYREKCTKFEKGNYARYMAGDKSMEDEIGESFIERCIEEIFNGTIDWEKYPY